MDQISKIIENKKKNKKEYEKTRKIKKVGTR